MDEKGGKSIVECIGIAASTKDSLSFMISSIRPINRLVDQSANAKGPFQPPVFTQPQKLKSVLKNSKEKYQIINPSTNEKNPKRPMSCSGGTRQRTTVRDEVNSFNTSSNVNSGLKGLKQMRNNFTNLDNPYEDRESKNQKEIQQFQQSQKLEKDESMTDTLKMNRPKSNGSSDLPGSKLLNRRSLNN